jgi:DNA-binding beta-propeller fold protein YncE
MPSHRYLSVVLTLFSIACFSSAAVAQEESAAPAVKVLIEDLESPSGVTVDPETGNVFIASRWGVYRYAPDKHTQDVPKSEKLVLAINSYPNPTDIYGKGPKYYIGPLGVAVYKDWLIVGDGSRPDSEELVRIYKIEKEMPKETAKEDSAAFTLGPIKAGEASAKGEGNFYGVTTIGDSIFVTSNGDDTKGWILKSDIADGKPGELTPFIASKESLEVDAPAAITSTPDGKELVVGQMGEVNVPGDSLLTFYNPEDGKLIRSLETGLSDIVGLAYSPKTKKLYATDFSWVDPTKGALYRLDIDGDTVNAVKIVDLEKPAGIAFDKEGKRLYITTFGASSGFQGDAPEEGSEKEMSPGKLVAIEAEL